MTTHFAPSSYNAGDVDGRELSVCLAALEEQKQTSVSVLIFMRW